MAQVQWDSVAKYIEAVFEQNGRVDRMGALDLALGDGADDDVIDAIDAIGSRPLNTPDEVKGFLVKQGLIKD